MSRSSLSSTVLGPLDSQTLLDAWERGRWECPLMQAMTLARLAGEELMVDALTPGQRDRRLFALRCRLFGDRAAALCRCDACHAVVEVSLPLRELLDEVADGSIVQTLQLADYRVQWRSPTCRDLQELDQHRSIQETSRELLRRCLVDVRRGEHAVGVDDCPPQVITEVASAMAKADPQADVRLDLSCPMCGSRWDTLFNIGSFLWQELSAWAENLLVEVHQLARAYGWSEQVILDLEAGRRRHYLELIGA